MKIIIVSDSHGKDEALDEILSKHPDADAYIHCGDIEAEATRHASYIVVKGNNDIYFEYPDVQILQAQSHRIYITHSHQLMYNKRQQQLADKAIAEGCDIACYGHTHVAADTVVNGVRLLNPGSIWRSRDGRGPSYMVMNIEGDNVQVELIELAKKKSKFFFSF